MPLAAAAVAAGHEVTIAASDQFSGRLPAPVIQSVPPGMTLHDAETEALAEVRDRTDPFAWPTALFGVVMPRHVRPRLLDHWSAVGAPDLVVYEGSNVGAALAARHAGVPAVAFAVSVAPAEFFLGLLARTVDIPMDVPLIDPTPALWRSPPAEGLERIPIRSVAWSDGPAPVAAGTPRTGTRAFLTLGTVAFGATDILRRSILETAELCTDVVVAAGPDADPALLGSLPAHVRVDRYVHQPSVLNDVDIAIHHGGSGTLLGCLAAGVSQIITPQGADQFMNAARLAELDLGSVVPNDAPAGSVAAAIRRTFDDNDLRARVLAVRDQIAGMPSPADVLTRLEEQFGH